MAAWTGHVSEKQIMYFVNSYITIAVYVVVIAGVMIAILWWRNSAASESRLKRMMVSCGIDEMSALYADNVLKLDMTAVRLRCRNCPVTGLCDRWLDGEAVAGNSFCPNVWHFTTAAARRNRAVS
jgi:hypothetical protein